DPLSQRDHRDDAVDRPTGDAHQCRRRPADRLSAAAVDEHAAHPHRPSRRADHAGHRPRRRRPAHLSRPAGLVQPIIDGGRHRRDAGASHAQLLGRAAFAGDHRLSLRLPPHSFLHHRDRSGARSGSRHAGRQPGAALPPCLPAAARARPGDRLLSRLRAGLLGLSLGGAARRAGRPDARHLDRRLSGRLRGLRLLDGLGDRDDNGRGPARHRRRRARHARRVLSRPGGRSQGMSAEATGTLGRPHRWLEALWTGLVWFVTAFFLVNIAGVIAAVAVNSFATRWLGTWLPAGYTTRWYAAAWDEFQLGDVLIATLQIVLIVVAVSILVGVPAGY